MPTLPSLDQGWGRGIRHTYDPAPVRLPSRRTPAHPPNASATAQAHDQKASEPPQHPPHASPPNGRQSSCQTPALPPSACLPAERQPTRQTPALQRKRTTSRQAQPPLESATPPVISALTRSIPWKTAIKIEGFVRLSDISLNQPRRDPDTDHSFLFRSTSDTPGNERCRTSKSACGDRVGTFGHTESIPIPTQARGISI